MGIIFLNEKTHISKVDIDFTKSNHTIITGTSGSGKTVLAETLLHRAWKQGCVIISLTDVKDEYELPFAQFPIEAEYHKQSCNKWGIPQETIPVKIYHPFTFDIPNEKLPEIEFYTIPIKSLNRTELTYIAETKTDKTSIKMFLEAIKHLKNNEGIHHLIWNIQKMTEAQEGNKKYSEDPEEFFTKGSKGGTEKQIAEIISYFNPFKTDYTLTPENCTHNIKIKEIINDQKNYHQLSTKYIKDEKQKTFYILNFIKQIIQNLTDNAKYPIVIYIDELAIVCPEQTEGYTVILSEAFGRYIRQIRSKGRGTSIIGCTQEYFKVNTEVRGSMTQKIFGKLSIEDRNNLNRAISIKAEGLTAISQLNIGEFLIEHIGFTTPIRSWMPPHAHKEEKYKYIEYYRKYKPEQLKQYNDMRHEIKELKKSIEQDVKEKVQKENEEAKKREQEKQQNKNNKTTEIKEQLKKVTQEKQELNEQRKKEIYNKWKEYKALGTPKSYREIATEYKIYLSNGNPDQQTIFRIIKKYKQEEETNDTNRNT